MASKSKLYETVYTGSNGPGRRVLGIQCPFCECVVEAYLWSLAGTGKRCECGALFDYYGTATREFKHD